MPSQPAETATFLALGDSYTIGESVPVEQRWPLQLADSLRLADIKIAEPRIIARTGWTTSELNAGIDRENPQGPFDLVSLLIGVNNQYRGYSSQGYRAEFAALLARAIAFAGGEPKRVIVLSIPDWGVTPFAQTRDPQRIALEIDLYNAINREESEKQGVRYVDITPISRQAKENPALIASDQLHPSGAMYALWVSKVLPEAVAVLAD